MTTNEIRAAEGLPPIDGGDELQHPVKKDENGQTVETPTRTPGTGRRQASQAEESGESTLYLYDVIVSDDYWGGISARSSSKN